MAPGTEPALAIVGSGRSGSGYIAAVLTAAGVRCGHEQWWNPMGERTAGLDADSSFCAVPDLTARPVFDGTIGHQVRDPLKVVASLTQLPDHGPFVECREEVLGRLPTDPLEAAMSIYVGWNLACEQLTILRWRVEDVDAGLIVDLAKLAGAEVDTRDAATALSTVPLDVNDHETRLALTWDDLPHTPVAVLLGVMAERYGYR